MWLLPKYSQDHFQVSYIPAFSNVIVFQMLHKDLSAIVDGEGLISGESCIFAHTWGE